MQAIQVKYLGPTNHRGSRVKAFCLAGSITLPFDYELTEGRNEELAAEALMEKLQWNKELRVKHKGSLACGDTVFVMGAK